MARMEWLTSHHLVALAHLVLTLVFLSLLLRDRRPAGNTLAWLLAIVLIPAVGIPLYFLVGKRKLRKVCARKGLLYPPVLFASTSPRASTVERLLLCSGAPQPTQGNALELLGDGVSIYVELLGLLEGARHTIEIETYILGHDEVGDAFLTVLERKAREGVKVRLLVDAVGALWRNRRALGGLIDAGGAVASFMPLFPHAMRGQFNLRNHRKLIVVDAVVAVTGGMNIAREYMGPTMDPRRWEELAVVVRGPAVADLRNLFVADWNFATGQALPAPEAALSVGAAGKESLHVIASGPDVEQDTLYDAMLSLIFSARARVWIVTPYFVPDESLCRALAVAARKGVDVRLIQPAVSDHWLANLGRGTFVRQLQDAGVKILRFPRMVHAKAVLVDSETALVGSANLDMRSLFLNFELGIFLYSPESLGKIERWITGLVRQSRRGLDRAGPVRRLVESIVRLLSPML